MPFLAEIEEIESTERRGPVRRTLRLRINAQVSRHAVLGVVHNISERGLLLESSAELTLGERIHVELPQAGIRLAIVVWNRDRLFGCEFEIPLTKAAVSATLLRAGDDGTLADLEAFDLPTQSQTDRGPDLEPDNGMLLVMAISFAVLLLVVLVFLHALFPPQDR